MVRKRRTDRNGKRSVGAFPLGVDRATLPRLAVAVVVGVALAGVAAAQAAKTIYDRRNPILAAQLLGSDDAKVVMWTVGALGDPKKLRDPAILRYAGHALRANPLNPAALRSLAFYEDAQKRPDKSRRLAELSADVSRRDPLTQLLLAQVAARKQQTKAAVGHIDLALTTLDEGRQQVFPLMSNILRYRALRDELPTLLDRPNTWVSDYLDYVMRNDKGGSRTAAEILLKANPASSAPVLKKIGPDLISTLAEAGEIGLMKSVYRRMRGKRPDVTRQPSLEKNTADPGIGWLGWTGVGDGSAGAELRSAGQSVEATVYASAGTNHALALRRVLMLLPGSYLHFEDRQVTFGPPSATAQFELRCIGGASDAVIWKGAAEGLDTDSDGSDGFIVPAGCPAQVLELFVSSPLGSGGSEFIIHNFDLRRSG